MNMLSVTMETAIHYAESANTENLYTEYCLDNLLNYNKGLNKKPHHFLPFFPVEVTHFLEDAEHVL
jgi:hypothetical protein